MKLIHSTDMGRDDVSVLYDLFMRNGMEVKIVGDLAPFANDRVDVTFRSTDEKYGDALDVVVMVWLGQTARQELRFRSVLFNRKKRDEIENDDQAWEYICKVADEANQNTDAHGAVSLTNYSGIFVDYSLTLIGGIPEHTIVETAKAVGAGAQGTLQRIQYYFERHR